MKQSKNLRKKIEYYWTYYKWHAAIILLVAAAVIYFVGTVIRGRGEDPYTIYVVNQYLDEQRKAEIVGQTAETLGRAEEEILLEDGIEFYPDDQEKSVVTGGAEKIATEYFAGGLDVMIAPKEVSEYYCGLGGIEERDGDVGVPLGESSLWAFDGAENYYFCMMSNSSHQEETEKLIQTFFE